MVNGNMKENNPIVSIIIVNYNGEKFLKNCISSIYSLNYPINKLDIILVDNRSTDNSIKVVESNFPNVRIIKNDENNYCKANNIGIKNAKGEFIARIDNDTKVDKNWLRELLDVIIKDNKIGVVGSKILFMNGFIQSTGLIDYPNFYYGDRGFKEKDDGQYENIEEMNYLCGASVLYRKECLLDIGDFDEDFNIYNEDIDMGIRCRQKGRKLIYVPKSIIYHHYNGTMSYEIQTKFIERNRLLLVAKYFPDKLGEALDGSGYYSRKLNNIYEILPDIFFKLIKHHNINKELIDSFFVNLRKLTSSKADYLAKRLYDVETIYTNEIKIKEDIVKDKERLFGDLLKEKDEKDTIIKDLIKERENTIKEKDSIIIKYTSEINNINKQVDEKEFELKNINKELNEIFNSIGYKYVLSNIWKVSNMFKKNGPNIKNN